MSQYSGLLIEGLVAVLLLVTIGYCMMLNRRLTRLRADEQTLKATISELITATEIAERAIGGLKVTVRECDENLGGKLAVADEIALRLTKQVEKGEDILARLSRIALAARPRSEASASAHSSEPADAHALVAAATAFNNRSRARAGGQASGLAA